MKTVVLFMLLSFILIVVTVNNSEAMALTTSLRLLTYTLLTSFYVNPWVAAQLCSSNCTSINGTPFPSLIDVSTEDLITGLETGLFTSVDLVNVRQL